MLVQYRLATWTLRKTKRQRLEEMTEWDEANEDGKVPDDENAGLIWSMQDPNKKEGKGF